MLHRQLSFEVIIIDDNSPDGTQEVAKRLQAVYGSERIVRLSLMQNAIYASIWSLWCGIDHPARDAAHCYCLPMGPHILAQWKMMWLSAGATHTAGEAGFGHRICVRAKACLWRLCGGHGRRPLSSRMSHLKINTLLAHFLRLPSKGVQERGSRYIDTGVQETFGKIRRSIWLVEVMSAVNHRSCGCSLNISH